ncbi:hypothetical protein SAMN05216360_11887 [Methylobacterium phyllostachyos]|uniref:Uncharacterized protein n=1 Tax=Methylobacterium phyllostachyos TaxID=582672 RepID=A0A1H0IBL1_9HYPH|nr:hypothetical protein [Methylobacterium phyllostachyos]SDO28650.1 hypothetical protein SAMN05216360_11887 [Methylobacterium phyllostachyos]
MRRARALPSRFPEPLPHVIPNVDPLSAECAGLPADGSLAIVGNAPGTGACGAAIDAADSIVRFNNAPGFGGGTGHRVTHLALVNRGGQTREWLADRDFLRRPVVRAAQAFILPFPMLPAEHNVPEPICWTREMLALLRPLGRPVHLLPEALHQQAHTLLGPRAAGRPNPSTGFLVTLALLLGRPAGARPAQAYGFGFAGWPGHPWAAERAWFAEAEAAGRLHVHPPSPTDR